METLEMCVPVGTQNVTLFGKKACAEIIPDPKSSKETEEQRTWRHGGGAA